tara:strand:+ start:403 stop:564 length:162 start_codon:yes stop_codon:yes gene_type:complete
VGEVLKEMQMYHESLASVVTPVSAAANITKVAEITWMRPKLLARFATGEKMIQ